MINIHTLAQVMLKQVSCLSTLLLVLMTFGPSIAFSKPSTSPEEDKSILYENGQRYYITPTGDKLLDKRSTGPLHPTLFDVLREGSSGLYISQEGDEGCRLGDMFLETIYRSHGFDARRYLHALATPASRCGDLAESSVRKLCESFQQEEACDGALPLALYVLQPSPERNFLNTPALPGGNFTCQEAVDRLLAYDYVPSQSREWQKVNRNLREDKREQYAAEVKANVPREEIRERVLAENPQATEREMKFAVREWIYEKTQSAPMEVSEGEVYQVARRRYTPAGAIENLLDFRREHEASCTRIGKSRYDSKVYAEAMNIPAHEILVHHEFVNRDNNCLCQ